MQFHSCIISLYLLWLFGVQYQILLSCTLQLILVFCFFLVELSDTLRERKFLYNQPQKICDQIIDNVMVPSSYRDTLFPCNNLICGWLIVDMILLTTERRFLYNFEFFYCVLYLILANKCITAFMCYGPFLSYRGSKFGNAKKNLPFLFLVWFQIFVFTGFLLKIPACDFLF